MYFLVILATSLHQLTSWSLSQPHCINLLFGHSCNLTPSAYFWSLSQPHCIILLFGHLGNLTASAYFWSLSQPHSTSLLFGHSHNLTPQAYFLVTLTTSLYKPTSWSLIMRLRVPEQLANAVSWESDKTLSFSSEVARI